MEKKDMVSVIIPTYKATNRLNEAIKSVLNQNYESYEVIVIDDNDSDSLGRQFTEKIMKKYAFDKRVVYIKHTNNMNGAVARNTGIRAAQGRYIAFLDDDDFFYPNRLCECVSFLQKSKTYKAIYTDVDIYKDDKFVETRKAEYRGKIWKELLLNEGTLGTGSNLFFDRICLNEVKGFDEKFLRFQDVEFMIRLTNIYPIINLNKTLVRKNLQETNIPSYPKFKENKKMIFEKFNEFIELLSEDERKRFYKNHYWSLLRSAIDSCNKAYIIDAYNNYKKYDNPSWKLRIKCNFPKAFKIFSGGKNEN